MPALRQKVALTALAGVGALVAINTLTKPSKTQSIANGMRRQLDDYNSDIHPDSNEESLKDSRFDGAALGDAERKP
ncbi:hypothetical protein LHYA1_G005187 [Lachnellula hyalina]|uniref:Uncharacterized protein n=1 Tax=Lachnellula hyalina TaxID=1316788 RepID=A0A8H8U2E2_9HELO|nr:uncharacterized protein LHYA1_G005187 [Lachnellula hyalina]TVY28001.1 hypothetical protein LHYA1_G005187 [Lachnellula hyalina]